MTEDDKEAFLARWSRRKREIAARPAETPAEAAAAPPALPALESLTPESDFAGFMHPKVKDELRRMALKKLFSDPHFNLPDPFEAYSGDWTGGEPIPPEMLAALNQARTVLLSPEEKEKLAAEEAQAAQVERLDERQDEKQQGDAQGDEPRRQDA